MAGLAYVMGEGSVGPQFESLAFSAVDSDSLLYAFSHEIGHNMGSSHDHVTDPDDRPAFPYSFGYVTAGGTAGASDFVPVAGRITFVPGQISQVISVPLLDDQVVEPEEQFGLRLLEAAGGRIEDGDTNATVQDDDMPGLTVSDVQDVEGDGLGTITRSLSFTVTLDTPGTNLVSVSYSTRNGSAQSGTDYDARSGVITFAPGQATAQVLVPLRGDLVVEDAETLQLVLSGPSGARIAREAGTGTIQNDDVPSISISDGAAREAVGGSDATFTVSLSNAWPTPISVSFRTTAGVGTAGDSDFAAQSGRLTFAPGQTSLPIVVRVLDDTLFERAVSGEVVLTAGQVRGVIRVPIVGDRILEKDEAFSVTLAHPLNAGLKVSRATGTIQNDDRDRIAPTVSILSPRALSSWVAWPAINGLAADATRLSQVAVRLQRLSDGRYWNGSAWVTSTDMRTSFRATLNGSQTSARWSVTIAPPASQTQSGAYRLIATASDAEGNTREAAVSFSIDRSGPALSIVNPRDKSTLRTLALVSGTAVDVPGGVAKVQLSI